MHKARSPFLLVILAVNSALAQWPDAWATDQQQQPTSRPVFCEHGYINVAWGFQHSGVVTDSDGQVYRYRRQTPWRPRKADAPTRQELEDRYSQGRAPLTTLPPPEVRDKLRLAEAASDGTMSTPHDTGRNMGSRFSVCFLPDANGPGYREVKLRMTGDWSYENLSPAASELARWLESLATSAP